VRRLLPSLPLLALIACSDFVGVEGFGPVPALSELDFVRVMPTGTYVMWELRRAQDASGYTIVGGVGLEAKDTLPPDVLGTFTNAAVESGAGERCLPGNCYYYYVSLGDRGVATWYTVGQVRTFLGPIQTAEEALLIALAEGYSWSAGDKQSGAVRTAPEGFELVVHRLVAFCDPIQVNRYHVLVRTTGTVQVLDEEVMRREFGVCL
jgi:hypothetical protein